MRYITIPKDVILDGVKKADGSDVSMSFNEMVRALVTSQKITESDTTISAFIDITDALKSATPGSVVELSNEHHEFLSALARGFEYAPQVKLALLPLIRAITSAASKKPEGA